jgi:hypothetical protein
MNEIVRKMAFYGTHLSPDIAKSVTTATAEGSSLTSQWLADQVTKAIVNLNPELFFIMDNQEKSPKGTKKFEFDRLKALPSAGGSYGQSGVTTLRTGSITERAEVELKILRRVGRVAGFQKDAAAGHVNMLEYEYQNQLEVFGHDLTMNCLYGNTGDQYRWDGLDRLITTNRYNEGRTPAEVKDFTALTNAIAVSDAKGGESHDRIILMSPQLWAAYNNLITTVRDNKSPINPGSIGAYEAFKFDAYWKFVSFMGIPVAKTQWTRPNEKMKPTVTLAGEATGGTLTDGTYYIQVAPITKHGEQIASDEVSITLSGATSTQRIKVTLSESHKSINDVGQDVEETYYYRIYMSTTSQQEKLVKIVTAMTYDVNGNMLTSDAGIAGEDFYVEDLVDSDSVNTAMQNDEPYIASEFDSLGAPINPPEGLIIWDQDKVQGLGTMGYMNENTDAMEGLITTRWLEPQDDVEEFMIKLYGALIGRFQSSSVIHRGLKVA